MNSYTFYVSIQDLKLKVQAEKEDGFLVHINLSIADGAETLAASFLAQRFQEILEGKRDRSSIPFKARGTPFQERVWDATCRIPFGRLASYSDIASEVGCGSPIAVGQALKSNPLPIIIPCHRVVGKKGDLTGFSCGLRVKALLLEFERKTRKSSISHGKMSGFWPLQE